MNDLLLRDFVTHLLEGDCSQAVKEAERLISSGYTAEQLVRNGIEPAAETLNEKCTSVQFNLLEIMLFGRAATEVMKVLYPGGSAVDSNKGTLLLATMEGDVHDLGKNITKMVLTCKGYRIIDCGKNCCISQLIDMAVKENPFAVGVSGLISSVVPKVRQIRQAMDEQGLSQVKIIAGGGTLKQLTPEQLNVDFVAETAFDVDRFLIEILGGENK
ncbi:MAG: Methionine synthase [Candidatus Dichloromethanomonas elyunquensis]|nr:MAG: Methionine synthase [Candidatus Dichloromethanomonas elyunquensis]